jgi:hypothetical protein
LHCTANSTRGREASKEDKASRKDETSKEDKATREDEASKEDRRVGRMRGKNRECEATRND